MEINYVVTVFPGRAVEDPTPQALYREEFVRGRAAARRNRSRTSTPTTGYFARIEAERELNNLRAFSET